MLFYVDSCYNQVAYINMDNNDAMKNAFSGDFNIDRLIMAFEIENGLKIEKSKTLIILDEIQEIPKALTSLKLVEEFFYLN